MAELFDIDHETGDLSQYDSTVTDGGDLSVTADAALAGTNYGLDVFIDDTNYIYGQLLSTNPGTGKFRFRFYIDPNTLTMLANHKFWIANQRLNAEPFHLFYLELREAGGGYELGFRPYADGGALVPDTAPISDDEHYVEVYIQQASTAIASDGSVEWWIDGVSKGTWVNKDIYDVFVNMTIFRLGAVSGIDVGTSGTFYIDQFKANDDGSEIGEHISAVSRHGRPVIKIEGAERLYGLRRHAIW